MRMAPGKLPLSKPTGCKRARTALLLACCATITAFIPAALGELPADTQDPLPLRRLLIAPERVAAEMKRVEQGILVQMTHDDFETQVRRASLAGEALKRPPRLVEARYRARLVDTALVGSGQWKVMNPAPEGLAGK